MAMAVNRSEASKEHNRIRASERYRENIDAERARTRGWHHSNPEQSKANNRAYRLRKLGMTVAAYEKMIADQGNLCGICQRPERRTSKLGKVFDLTVDHDHRSGVVRGLLCHSCNVAIGHLDDNPVLLHRAIAWVTQGGQ